MSPPRTVRIAEKRHYSFGDERTVFQENLVIFEMHDADSAFCRKRDFPHVILSACVEKMIMAVELNREFFFGTVKIENKRPQTVLPPKQFPVQSAIFQNSPQKRFRRSHIPAQLPPVFPLRIEIFETSETTGVHRATEACLQKQSNPKITVPP